MRKEKFEFGTDFQELILQYTVTDKLGFKALPFYEDKYFTLIEHAVIAHALKKYYKRYKRVPEEPYLRETLRTIYNKDKLFDVSLLPKDQENISKIVSRIYSKHVSQPDQVLTKCIDFARFVRFKEELEKVDINHFDGYEAAIKKLKEAANLGIELQENYGTFLIGGMNDRAHKRDLTTAVAPTPFQQVNKLLNSGGILKGSVIVVMSKEKRFKTGFLINTARGYLRMRQKGVYIDLENGEMAITTRTEQSLSNQSQSTINSGEYDNKLLKLFRKYKRLGAELAIKRFPALHTNTDHIQEWFDKLKRDFNFIPQWAIFDYGLILGSRSGTTDKFSRISEAFLDMKNFAEINNLDCIWTAAHIKRDADKRTAHKYQSTDIADCIDITKHIDGLWGLQESEEEMDNGVMRLEMIEQRNGLREGNAMFWVDIEKQRMKEFNKHEILDYREQTGEAANGGKKKERKTDI